MLITSALPWLLSLLAITQAPAPPKQAVVDTTAGTFIIDLDPQAAPNYIAHFMTLVGQNAYDGTTFHTMIRNGMVQGGDPLSKEPAKRDLYGTGGLNAVKADPRAAMVPGGSVAAVLIPGKPDSAGAQFFVLLADQPTLANQFTVFGHIADGIEVLQKISATPVDEKRMATERVEITHITIRDTPPEPFVHETVEELGTYRAVLDTSMGPITIEFLLDKAPNTVRQFMRLAANGIYNGMAFHRVAPGFVIQTGALSSRPAPLTAKQQALAHNLPPEFNDTKHVKGIVSMARLDAPDSAQTSFFICTAESKDLDGVYTAFGRVVDGMSVVEAIEGSPREPGTETPSTRIELRTVRVEKK